jgi:hypothetical protein
MLILNAYQNGSKTTDNELILKLLFLKTLATTHNKYYECDMMSSKEPGY